MKPFISSADSHFILRQARSVMNGHLKVNDAGVLGAVEELAAERAEARLSDTPAEFMELIGQVAEVRNEESFDRFREQLLPFVIAFPELTEHRLKKLFPKVKKLHPPDLSSVEWRDISYFGWNDLGAARKYLVWEREGKLHAKLGQFRPSGKKGVCAICNGLDEVGLFLSETRHSGGETYTKRGNYICVDSEMCNRRIDEQERLDRFTETIGK
ncbi:FusB/FusC family EF-G-binding protein [Bhargavaea ullalensis]|uniref:FBP C-terminal treble-clef zinc-finger n=1 Tax=Bhargavaea ullalensis TaxID=1265685 RepID=A0ABV2GDG8_9BACL